jgi:hypothetical protein
VSRRWTALESAAADVLCAVADQATGRVFEIGSTVPIAVTEAVGRLGLALAEAREGDPELEVRTKQRTLFGGAP